LKLGALPFLAQGTETAPGIPITLAIAKRAPARQQTHSWAVCHINGTPAKLVGIIYNALDQQTAVARAIVEYDGAMRTAG
jgi:hypothetical protein